MTVPDRLILHGSPHSQFTYKVALMLALCGTKFWFRYVSFRAGTHRTPTFRTLSRFGQVPVLQHGPRVLVQAGAILEYLADLFGRFGGRTEAERQEIREWLYWDTDRLSTPIYHSYGFKLASTGLIRIDAHPAVVDYHRARAGTGLDMLDSKLVGRSYAVGDELTIADLACYGDVAFASRADIDLTGWPNVCDWCARIAQLRQVRPPMELLPMADAEFD
jgi:glutathione S-transferase